MRDNDPEIRKLANWVTRLRAAKMNQIQQLSTRKN